MLGIAEELLFPVLFGPAGEVAEGDAADSLVLDGALFQALLYVLGQDIGYPIDTKRSDIHGRLDLKPVDNDDDSRSPMWFKPSSAA